MRSQPPPPPEDLLQQEGRPSASGTSTSGGSITATSTPPGTPSSTQPPLSRHSGKTSVSHASGSNADARSWTSTLDSADLDHIEYFPAEDSSDSSSPETPTLRRAGPSYSRASLTQVHKPAPSSSGRLFRYLAKKLGRSFNKAAGFRGQAFLPNDQIERERNILQHELIHDVLDGKLFLSPIRPRAVLDIGTGPGLWCLDVAKKYPDAQVLGVDVDPVVPPHTLPNCQFEVMDAAKPWALGQTFDLIHMRMVGEVSRSMEDMFDEIFEHLNPGGWVEITEWLCEFQSPNRTIDKLSLWNKAFRQGLKKFGSSPVWVLGWKDIMVKKGCHGVTERRHPVPVNPWPPGKRLQRQGAMMEENVHIFLEASSFPVFTGALGWTDEQVKTLLSGLKKEVSDPDVHVFLTLDTVYCQKPRLGSSWSSRSNVASNVESSAGRQSGSRPPTST